MTEKELRDSIVEAARAAGWAVMFVPKVPVKYQGQPIRWMNPIGGDGKGWLDLFLLRERPLAIEVKARESGAGYHVTPEQQAWLDRWHVAGINAFVWTIRDWPEVVLAELGRHERYRPPVRDAA